MMTEVCCDTSCMMTEVYDATSHMLTEVYIATSSIKTEVYGATSCDGGLRCNSRMMMKVGGAAFYTMKVCGALF